MINFGGDFQGRFFGSVLITLKTLVRQGEDRHRVRKSKRVMAKPEKRSEGDGQPVIVVGGKGADAHVPAEMGRDVAARARL